MRSQPTRALCMRPGLPRANKSGAHGLKMVGTNFRSYTSGARPTACHCHCSLTTAFLAPAGRGGSLRGGLHDVLHDVLADPAAHGGADDSREAIMEAGPDARVRYFLAKDIQIGEAMDDPGCCRACHRHLGDRP